MAHSHLIVVNAFVFFYVTLHFPFSFLFWHLAFPSNCDGTFFVYFYVQTSLLEHAASLPVVFFFSLI